jgi:predicted permease
VIGVVLLTRSFAALKAVDVGFQPHNVLTARIDLAGPGFGDDAVVGFYRDLLDRLRELPGVRAAGATRIIPLSRQIGNWTITVDEPDLRDREDISPDWQIVTPGYVEAIGLDIVAGRSLALTDDADAPLVALVSETMARRVWGARSAVGRRFHLGTLDQPWIEVVGVVRDVRHNAVVEDGRLEMYLVHSQWSRAQGGGPARAGMSLVVRTDRDPFGLLAAVRREVRALGPAVPISDVKTLDRVVDTALGRPRFTTALFGVFAGLSLALATIGLYAMMSYTAARRTREMGIRLALGANPRAVAGLVVSEGVAMTAAGLTAGLIVAGWATRFLTGELYLVGRLDPWTFGLVPLLLLTVSAVASYLPARRAARVSPLVALRDG